MTIFLSSVLLTTFLSFQCMPQASFSTSMKKLSLSKLIALATTCSVALRPTMIEDEKAKAKLEKEKKEFIYLPQHKACEIPTVFAHGLYGNYKHGLAYHVDTRHRYVFAHAYIEGPLHVFDFDDAYDPKKSCLGQNADIARLHDICQKNEQAILNGSSRGAATGLNYLGTHQPKNIRAAIFESPFDSIATIVKHDAYFGFLEHLLPYIPYKGFPNYNPYGIQPIQIVDKIDKTIPILLICSNEDKRIPASSTLNLYKKLLKSRHKHVYLLHVEHGEHARILQGKDGELVKHVVHAFLAHYKLPHNQTWAQAGQERFKLCQPLLLDSETKSQDILDAMCCC